ncbi:MAG: hypothetical protein AAGG44_09335 [Planctomycetota bacterium]
MRRSTNKVLVLIPSILCALQALNCRLSDASQPVGTVITETDSQEELTGPDPKQSESADQGDEEYGQ